MSKHDESSFVEIKTQEDLEARLVGRTIVRVHREPDTGCDWQMGENTVTLWLDDGSRVEFVGWGYDTSGTDTMYYPAAERLSEGGLESPATPESELPHT